MKTLLLSAAFVIMTLTGLLAQNPIPSYAFPVYGRANFQEGVNKYLLSREKRDMEVKSSCASPTTSCSANIWVYSLDGRDVKGPFVIYGGGETLIVPIDEREWGVYAESEDKIILTIWTSDQVARQ